MYVLLLIIVVIVCILLGCIVLIQNPKGGGLTSNFSSQSQLMGVQKTGDFLEKGTWVLAITLMVLSLMINVVAKNGTAKDDPIHDSRVDKSLTLPANSPATAPLTVPAGAIPPVQKPVKK